MAKKVSSWGLLVVVTALVTIAGIVFVVRWQYHEALKPVSHSQKLILVTVESGASAEDIAKQLQDQGLIKKAWAFEWFVRNQGYLSELKAGTYAFTPNDGVEAIVKTITTGEVATDLVTVIPGNRIDQVEAGLINAGFSPQSVIEALKSEQYRGHPALVDLPTGVSLEGYLFPESFQKTAETTAEEIIQKSLDEMASALSPRIRKGIANQGMNVHEGVTLASIIEQEVTDPGDKRLVAGVFYNRLAKGINLESDATAPYGAVLDGFEPSLIHDSAYNTYLNKGLPPGPISNVSLSSLEAVSNPASTDFLFFVSGDDGTTYFATTIEQHERNIAEHCKKLCNN
ncbi:MAG: endolytic transglycosylase MltG [bacterium]|nr:endolytic transglycosylase MltG [bacterium]